MNLVNTYSPRSTPINVNHFINITMFMHALPLLMAFVAATTISPPMGRYGIAYSTTEFVDQDRLDPFAPGQQPRRLMLSIFEPVAIHEPCHLYKTQYMPPTTAAAHDEIYSAFGIPNGTFASLENEFCKSSSKPAGCSSYPIAVFSPGLGNSRLLYSAMATSLSSQGLIVITVDHPYDASIVEYPDGSVVRAANISSEAQIVKTLEARQKDVIFIVDQLLDDSSRLEILRAAQDFFRPPRVMAYGHSLGGATAATAMMNDSRILAGINLDGDFYDPFIEPGLDCPFMLVGRENKTLRSDRSWATIWPRLRSTKVDLQMEGFMHGTFTDLPLLAKVLGLTEKLPAEGKALLGSIDAERASEIVTAYTSSFFRFAVREAHLPFDRRLRGVYPEVKVLEDVRRGRCRSDPFWFSRRGP